METAYGDSGFWEQFLVTTSVLLLQPPRRSCGAECGFTSNLCCPEGASLKELFRHRLGCPSKAKQHVIWLWKCSWISLSPGVTSQGLEGLLTGLAQVAEELETPPSTVWPPCEEYWQPLLRFGQDLLPEEQTGTRGHQGDKMKDVNFPAFPARFLRRQIGGNSPSRSGKSPWCTP